MTVNQDEGDRPAEHGGDPRPGHRPWQAPGPPLVEDPDAVGLGEQRDEVVTPMTLSSQPIGCRG